MDVNNRSNSGDNRSVAIWMWSVLMYGAKNDRHRNAPCSSFASVRRTHANRLSNNDGHSSGQSWLPICAMTRACAAHGTAA